jgi:cysteinyl-tRNA synthetase
MRFLTAQRALCLSTLKVVSSFSISANRLSPLLISQHQRVFQPTICTKLQASDYDDWYSDFDPSAFDDVSSGGVPLARESKRSFSTSARGRTGRRSMGHEYERDISADNSNVDVDEINALIADRFAARGAGQFEEADSIRDRLLDEHGVMIFDKEKKWRSGCSRSGSGMRLRTRNEGRERGRDRDFKARDFGPNGHDYTLSYDSGPNVSTLSESEIHQRIAHRLQCKMSRKFREADEAQSEFEKFGIYVDDGKKEWRADGIRFFSGDNKYQTYVKAYNSEETDNLSEIEELINQRLAARKSRNYQEADNIQNLLKERFNVEINDKKREWRIRSHFSKNDAGGLITMAATSLPSSNIDEIQALVNERDAARKRRDFQTADEILADLFETYNVQVEDKLRQWSVGGKFNSDGPKGKEWTYLREDADNLSEEEEQRIHQLLTERKVAQSDRNYDVADRIRDRLMQEFSVRLNDKLYEWKVVREGYIMSPASSIDSETKAIIEKKLRDRGTAKMNRDYVSADAIRDELFQIYHVSIDDRKKHWYIEVDETFNSGLDFEETNELADIDKNASSEYDLEDTVEGIELPVKETN